MPRSMCFFYAVLSGTILVGFLYISPLNTIIGTGVKLFRQSDSHMKTDMGDTNSTIPMLQFESGANRTIPQGDSYKYRSTSPVPVDTICTIPKLSFRSSELARTLTACADPAMVPNIMHYVWLSKREFQFHHMTSFMSAYRYQKPCFILVHCDIMPYGKWWDYTVPRMCNKLIHVYREQPTSIFGNKVNVIEHRADITKIEALKEYGGIAMDDDQVILRSLDPLRKFDYTAGIPIPEAIGIGLSLAKKDSEFLQLFYSSYKTFKDSQLGYHSVLNPYKIAMLHPKLIHIEIGTFYSPNYRNPSLLFEKNYDWSKSYSMHLYFRFYKKHHNPEDIKTLNTTIGSVYRHVFYGHRGLITSKDSALLKPLPKLTRH